VNRVSYLDRASTCAHAAPRFRFYEHGARRRVARAVSSIARCRSLLRIPGNEKLQGNSPKGLLLGEPRRSSCRETSSIAETRLHLPFERWLRGDMRPVVEDALLKGIGIRLRWTSAPTKRLKRFLAERLPGRDRGLCSCCSAGASRIYKRLTSPPVCARKSKGTSPSCSSRRTKKRGYNARQAVRQPLKACRRFVQKQISGLKVAATQLLEPAAACALLLACRLVPGLSR